MLILSLAVFSVTLLANLSAIEGHYHQQYYQQQPRTCQYWVNGYIQRGPCQNGGGGQVGHYVKPIKKVIKKVLRPLHGRPHQPQHRPQPVPQYPARQPKQHYPSDRCVTTDGLAGCCKPQAYCYFQYDSITVYAANLCIQPNGQQGVCCPDKEIREPLNPYSPIRIPPKIQNVAKVPKIHERDLNSAAEHSRKVIQETLEVEQSLARRGFFQRKGSMQAQHQGFFGKQTDISRTIAKDGLINLETSIRIARQFRLNPQQARDGLSKFSLRNTALFEHCIKEPKCYPSKYRTYDGSCNNLEKPLWGRSHTAMTRLLPPAYADGLNELRRAKDEDELPLPRVVSRNLAHDKDIPDRKFTLIVMQWGQFLDHDLTLAASTRVDSIEGEGILCCPDDLGAKADLVHPSCKPIWIDDNDPFYAKRKEPVTCLNFIRNAPSPRPGCTLGPREQTNTLTHYLDGSMIYGSTDDRARDLRLFVDGLLKFDKVNNAEFLPFDRNNQSDECSIPEHENQRGRLQCFVGGDVRVNEQTGLTIMHLIWLREHNRVARELKELNPQWNDEIIYQEARRIVAAEVQHITFNEWQPLIVGRRTMKEFNLMPKPTGFSYDYDPSVNPSIINSFATAAYRFHSLIQGLLKLMTNQGQVKRILMLRNLFNNPSTVYEPGNVDGYLNALTGQPTQTFDNFFTKEITEHLFQEEHLDFGMDLISLNIQRGREHGLPGYNHYRQLCGQRAASSFEELNKVMRHGAAEVFSKLYRHVDDIDLFVGLNHEKPLADGVVGPTMACILAEQSRRNKLGDRFWYENGNLLHSFSPEQLDEIRKSTMARIVCDNADTIDHMQPLAFLQSDPKWNPRTACAKLPYVNLKLWKNEPVKSAHEYK